MPSGERGVYDPPGASIPTLPDILMLAFCSVQIVGLRHVQGHDSGPEFRNHQYYGHRGQFNWQQMDR